MRRKSEDHRGRTFGKPSLLDPEISSETWSYRGDLGYYSVGGIQTWRGFDLWASRSPFSICPGLFPPTSLLSILQRQLELRSCFSAISSIVILTLTTRIISILETTIDQSGASTSTMHTSQEQCDRIDRPRDERCAANEAVCSVRTLPVRLKRP